jgi:hypothetical protein
VAPQDNEVISASSGSGFAVSADGYVITNHHVIEGCQKVVVHYKGKELPVTVVTYDPQNDLALLKGDFRPQTVFALSGNQPELLQDVYVAGYPFGNKISSSVKVTKGIISSLTGIGNNFSNIQIDAALQSGNSGGPILDEMGNIVGVAVSKLDAKYMYDNFGIIPENTNFGIKANVVRSVLESNEVSSPPANRSEISKSQLGKMISSGTYYISCWMTMAQVEKLRTKKVMFEPIFLAGNPRTLALGARLGFHGSYWPTDNMKNFYIRNKAARGWDDPIEFATWAYEDGRQSSARIFEYMFDKGVSPEFTIKISKLGRDDYWYPTRDELVNANILKAAK